MLKLAMRRSPPQGRRHEVVNKLLLVLTLGLLAVTADAQRTTNSVNRATFEALEKHWITSASILVPCPWFPEVARFAQAHPDADLGVHLALNSEWTDFRWGPVSPKDKVSSLLDQHGYLPLLETDVAAHAKPK